MRYTIENEFIRLTVDSLGAEMVSAVDLTTGSEMIWCADPAVWNRHAPILFPYAGKLTGGHFKAEDGKIYAGCNVENVSYPCGACAEQGAISAMIAGGSRKISKILIIADTKEPIMPCGACLQRIKEFSAPETEILLAGPEGIRQILSINELLPHAFAAGEVKNA